MSVRASKILPLKDALPSRRLPSPQGLWWHNADEPEWHRLRQLVSHLFHCLQGDALVRAVEADPFTFDQLLDEWAVCESCGAEKKFASKRGGYQDCHLEWDGHKWRGCRNWYLDVEEHHFNDRHWWEFVKRHCGDKQLRAHEIAERLGRYREVGGIKVTEVDEDEVPF